MPTRLGPLARPHQPWRQPPAQPPRPRRCANRPAHNRVCGLPGAIGAGLLNYNFTGNNVHNDVGGSSNYAYLNLQSGLNLGAWRLRDNTTWSYSSGAANNENQWQHINTWLERDITPLRSRLTLGDRYALEVFDPQDALIALCTVLAIDCCDEEHSR